MNTTATEESLFYRLELDPEKSNRGYIKYEDPSKSYILQASTLEGGRETFKLLDGDTARFNTALFGDTVVLSFEDLGSELVPFRDVSTGHDDILEFKVGDPDTVTVTVVYDEPPLKVE